MFDEIIKNAQLIIDNSFKFKGINNLVNSNLINNIVCTCKLIVENKNDYKKYFDNYIRYMDYYSYKCSLDDNINFFNENYENADEFMPGYKLYAFNRCLSVILDDIVNIDLMDFSLDEYFNDYVVDDEYFKELNFASKNVISQCKLFETAKLLEFDELLPFEKNNPKFKILFTGRFLDDIKNVPVIYLNSIINKIDTQLARKELVDCAEGVDHIRDEYNFPVMRIQVLDDYRLLYLRKNNVSSIIGITLKNGKNSDYSQYDCVAKKKDIVYSEIDDFIKDKLPLYHDHYKVLYYLKEKVAKRKAKIK